MGETYAAATCSRACMVRYAFRRASAAGLGWIEPRHMRTGLHTHTRTRTQRRRATTRTTTITKRLRLVTVGLMWVKMRRVRRVVSIGIGKLRMILARTPREHFHYAGNLVFVVGILLPGA